MILLKWLDLILGLHKKIKVKFQGLEVDFLNFWKWLENEEFFNV
jgi:hypothetical protein